MFNRLFITNVLNSINDIFVFSFPPPILLLKAGLGAGTTEAVMVVTPMDVIKIRLQARSEGVIRHPQVGWLSPEAA